VLQKNWKKNSPEVAQLGMEVINYPYILIGYAIAFQINILAERPDRFWKPVRSENFYFFEKL